MSSLVLMTTGIFPGRVNFSEIPFFMLYDRVNLVKVFQEWVWFSLTSLPNCRKFYDFFLTSRLIVFWFRKCWKICISLHFFLPLFPFENWGFLHLCWCVGPNRGWKVGPVNEFLFSELQRAPWVICQKILGNEAGAQVRKVREEGKRVTWLGIRSAPSSPSIIY